MADEVKQSKKSLKNYKKDYTAAVGRRKSAVARVRLYATMKPGLMWGEVALKKGDILVNGTAISEYFPSELERFAYTEPLRITNAHQQNYTITIKIDGGGRAGQLDAVVAGISNALSDLDSEKYRSILKKRGFMERDSRVRERRTVGMGGKSRRKKQSPKR